MQRSLYALGLILLTACHSPSESPNDDDRMPATGRAPEQPVDTGVMTLNYPPEDAQNIPDTVHLTGHFDMDASKDTAYGIFFKETGNKQNVTGEGEADFETQYVVRFEGARIAPMPVITGRHIRLVNEGDLNEDGKDEISVFAQLMNKCAYNVSTWSYNRGRWVRITAYWTVPTACDYLSDEDLQNRIVLEDGMLFYYETDITDKDFPLVKKELTLIKP